MVAKKLKSPNTAEENGLSPLVRQERSNTTNSSKGRLSRKTTYTRIQGNLILGLYYIEMKKNQVKTPEDAFHNLPIT
jgi:hypothetical protein